jgi:hypothetical protein
MQLDIILAFLLIGIGALISYIADEQFGLTPRLAAWIGRVLGQY